LISCSIAEWYPHFKKHTFATIVVPVTSEFVSWLVTDGVFVDDANEAIPTRSRAPRRLDEDDYDPTMFIEDKDKDTGGDDEGVVSDQSTRDHRPLPMPMPQLVDKVRTAISELGGIVMPKFTWSAPKDAIWVSMNKSMRCTTPDEVFLLLKSSDRVSYDCEEAIAECKDANEPYQEHVIALRRWFNLKPGREFRCFVINKTLTAISQRDLSRYYPEIKQDKNAILVRIQEFYDGIIRDTFPLETFAFDCYVPENSTDRLRVIDFNPPAGATSALLFEEWEQIYTLYSTAHTASSPLPEIKIVEEGEVLSIRPDTVLYGVPYDFVGADTVDQALQHFLAQSHEK
jgi:hypothetical protein